MKGTEGTRSSSAQAYERPTNAASKPEIQLLMNHAGLRQRAAYTKSLLHLHGRTVDVDELYSKTFDDGGGESFSAQTNRWRVTRPRRAASAETWFPSYFDPCHLFGCIVDYCSVRGSNLDIQSERRRFGLDCSGLYSIPSQRCGSAHCKISSAVFARIRKTSPSLLPKLSMRSDEKSRARTWSSRQARS